MKFNPGSIRRSVGLGALVAVALTAACDTSSSPTGNDGIEPIVGLAVNDTSNNYNDVDAGVVRVCAFYPGGGPYGPSMFSASRTGAGTVVDGQFPIEPTPHCYDAWELTEPGTATVTVTLESLPATLKLLRVFEFVTGEDQVDRGPAESLSVEVSDEIGATFWFKIDLDDTPSGGQGCTPGYWRQPHHYDNWTAPYDPDGETRTTFHSVFAGDDFGSKTLAEVVKARGGGINALARHAVAALLNAASPDVSYDLTPQQVIDAYNAAQDGNRKAQNAQKDIFEGFNEQGCPLN